MIREIKNYYRYFSIAFHIFVAGFIIYTHLYKDISVKIDIRILKTIGVVSIIMGFIFYFYSNNLIN